MLWHRAHECCDGCGLHCGAVWPCAAGGGPCVARPKLHGRGMFACTAPPSRKGCQPRGCSRPSLQAHAAHAYEPHPPAPHLPAALLWTHTQRPPACLVTATRYAAAPSTPHDASKPTAATHGKHRPLPRSSSRGARLDPHWTGVSEPLQNHSGAAAPPRPACAHSHARSRPSRSRASLRNCAASCAARQSPSGAPRAARATLTAISTPSDLAFLALSLARPEGVLRSKAYGATARGAGPGS
jgi:hypothetical protein